MAFSHWERALLEQPAFAKLATLAADGSPQLTVMWYRLDGEELRMITPANTQKVRNLLRDPRAAIVVEHPDDSYRYLELHGSAEIVRDADRNRTELQRIAERYIGGQAEAFTAARDPHTRALIIFRPTRVRAYGQDRP